MQIKKSHKVRLKNGGPEMTVVATAGRQVVCAWAENGEIRAGTFYVSMLAQTVYPSIKGISVNPEHSGR